MRKVFLQFGFIALLAAGGLAVAGNADAPGLPSSSATARPEAIPQWSISSFPDIAINQKNYPDITLADYVKANKANLKINLTPGKPNPNWINLSTQGVLHIAAGSISPEDADTTQVIYLTAVNTKTGESSSAEITLKITTNDQLPAPEWRPGFALKEAISSLPYFVNLAAAVNTENLADSDTLTFELVNSPVPWLQIGDNGFSLTAKKIPEDATGKSYEITLRVTSKMSGRSSDLNGKIYVNQMPRSLQWSMVPPATINKPYTLDLSQYVSSNLRNDQIAYQVDMGSLPSWLSVQNHQIITGTPEDPSVLEQPQKLEITAKSLLTGVTGKAVMYIRMLQIRN